MGADDYIAKPFSQRLLLARHPRGAAPHEMRAVPGGEEEGGMQGAGARGG
jgi:hypothetical protein